METPIITVGMSSDDATKLLGQPTGKMSESELLGRVHRVHVIGDPSKKFVDTEYWLFDHPAGQYRIVIREGVVVRIDAHPEIPDNPAPPVATGKQLSDSDETIMHSIEARFIENLKKHLERAKASFPENTLLLDQHFGSDTIATLARLGAEKMIHAQRDSKEYSCDYNNQSVWYQVTAVPEEREEAANWFVRVYGGYNKLLERIWNSPHFKSLNSSVFYHTIFGWTEGSGAWVALAIIPLKPEPLITGILPLNCMTQEERRAAGV